MKHANRALGVSLFGIDCVGAIYIHVIGVDTRTTCILLISRTTRCIILLVVTPAVLKTSLLRALQCCVISIAFTHSILIPPAARNLATVPLCVVCANHRQQNSTQRVPSFYRFHFCRKVCLEARHSNSSRSNLSIYEFRAKV